MKNELGRENDKFIPATIRAGPKNGTENSSGNDANSAPSTRFLPGAEFEPVVRKAWSGWLFLVPLAKIRRFIPARVLIAGERREE